MEFQYQCGILTLFLTFPFTESQTIEDFGETLHLDRSDLEHLRSVFLAVENGDIGKFFLSINGSSNQFRQCEFEFFEQLVKKFGNVRVSSK